MPTYWVNYEKINGAVRDAKPHGPYRFQVEGTDIYAASIRAVMEMYRVGMSPGDNDVWNGYIEGSKGERQELMKNGATLINMNTGRPESLEEKVIPKEDLPKGQLNLTL